MATHDEAIGLLKKYEAEGLSLSDAGAQLKRQGYSQEDINYAASMHPYSPQPAVKKAGQDDEYAAQLLQMDRNLRAGETRARMLEGATSMNRSPRDWLNPFSWVELAGDFLDHLEVKSGRSRVAIIVWAAVFLLAAVAIIRFIDGFILFRHYPGWFFTVTGYGVLLLAAVLFYVFISRQKR